MTALSYFLSLSQLFVYSSTKGIGNSLGFSLEDPALALLILTGLLEIKTNQNKRQNQMLNVNKLKRDTVWLE